MDEFVILIAKTTVPYVIYVIDKTTVSYVIFVFLGQFENQVMSFAT